MLMAGSGGPPGLCNKNKIEWMLSQDSVGNFVQIGDEKCDVLDYLHHSQPEKKSADYAIGFVSRHGTRVTRGTPQPQDDVNVPAGFSWLTLTSPTEGTSHVTAFAPDAKGWDTRQQSATIYWIDTQWSFPPPAIARAGERQVLTTQVTRQSNSSPLVGWIVRYEIVGGPAAQFVPANSQVVEVQTNANGQASAEIVPTGREAGVTQIAVQIIRPAGSDGLPRLAVGQGDTSVSWSAPGLALRVLGPQLAESGAPANFRIEISNPGDIAARDVEISDVLPPGLTLTGANPQPQVLGDRLTWRIAELPPHSAQAIDLVCTASGKGDIRHCASARTADGLTAENCVVTRVYLKSLGVDMKGPQVANVGDTVQYQVTITNRGSSPVNNVVISDRFDPGFQHAETASPYVRRLGNLQPGQTEAFAINFAVVAPGRICHTLEITADAENPIVAEGCLQAGARAVPPDLRTSITPSALTSRVGDPVGFTMEILNAGQTPVTNLRIVASSSASLQQSQMTDADIAQRHAPVTWVVINLAPGQKVTKQLLAACLQPDARACTQMTVSSDQTRPDVKEACVAIQPQQAAPAPIPGVGPGVNPIPAGPNPVGPNPVGPGPVGPAPVAVAGQLKLEINEQGDSIRLGRVFFYEVKVTNGRNVPDKNVAVTLILPDGVTYSKLFSPPGLGILRASPDGRTLELTPITELRAGEAVSFRLDVTATKAGQHNFQAVAKSQQQPAPITAKEGTTIFGE